MKPLFILILWTYSYNSFAQSYGFNTLTKPIVENKRSVISYLQSIQLDTNNICYVKDGNYVKVLSALGGFPAVMIFNKNGYQGKYTNKFLGCANPTAFISELKKNDNYLIDSSLSLRELKEYIAPYTLRKVANKDYTIVIFWAKFLGLYGNGNRILDYENAVIGNKRINAELIKVDLDVQDTWSKEDQQKYLDVLTKLYNAIIAAKKN